MSTTNLKTATFQRYVKNHVFPKVRGGRFTRVSADFVARANTHVERLLRELEAEKFDDVHGPEVTVDAPEPMLEASARIRVLAAFERKIRRWAQREVQSQPSRGVTV